MKALSIRQPWAWLVCAGHKDVENRNWHIRMPPLLNYPADPKRIYVHTGKAIDKEAFKWIAARIPIPTIQKFMVNGLPDQGMFITGAIIGEVDIVGCKYRRGDMNSNLFSVWHEIGMYGLLLANPVLYAEPILCKGKLGFFEPDIDVLEGMEVKVKISYIGTQIDRRVGPQTVIRHQSDGKDSALDPGQSQKIWNHSPDGFQWGYGGSGPAQLALAILLDVTGDEARSVRLHQDFKWDKIATLDDSFVLTIDEIHDWLASHP